MPIQRLPQPPRKTESRFDEWLVLLWRRVSELGAATGVGTLSHTSLSNLNSATHSHLTSTEKTDLTDGGSSALHYHSADRDRSTHTGTQTSATISDFAASVSAVVTAGGTADTGESIIATQVFGG